MRFIILTILLAWDALYSPAGAKESDRRRGDPSQSRWGYIETAIPLSWSSTRKDLLK